LVRTGRWSSLETGRVRTPRKAADVTRKRMYLETMESVLGTANKTIIDSGAHNTGVVPYLSLDSLPRERPAQPSQSGGNP
jgi:modulator of FtsH protease HflK